MLKLALTALLFAAPADDAGQEALLAAVRKGDAPGVKALLEQGVPVDAKFRYDRTALSFAADRGHTEIVRLLLERGADVNAKDTFYGMTALGGALAKGHVDVVRVLLEKGATGGEAALGAGVEKGDAALVALAIEKAKPTADELSVALAGTEKGAKADIAELLRKAGAVPLPPADHQVAAEVLATYVGSYRGSGGFELKLEIKEGALTCMTCGPQPQALGAVDAITFRPRDDPSRTVIVKVEKGKAVGLLVRRGRQENFFARVEEKK